MDRIFIHGLKITSVIGVHEWERRIPQTLRLDLSFAADVGRAAESDLITATIDYSAIAARLQDLGGQLSCSLVETFAERCAECLIKEFRVPWVQIRVTKEVSLPKLTEVGVLIERGQLSARDDGE